MKSLRELYKIGRGPSSSHTMGPVYAAEELLRRIPELDSAQVVLYGSLAKTGRGHHTDSAVRAAFGDIPCKIIFDTETTNIPHENTLDLIAMRGGRAIYKMRAMSVGGGAVEIEGEYAEPAREVYYERSFREIAEICRRRCMRLSDYVFECEGEEIRSYLADVWHTMNESIRRGLSASGTLEGGLNVERKAKSLFEGGYSEEREAARENRIVCAYAFAVAEENASGGIIVTSPTCGAAGVLPAALAYVSETEGADESRIIRALAAGGIVGNLVKRNASISGAECGCQAEIGTATSMAAAAIAELYGMELGQLEYAAESAMEHQLGLTCDPIDGLVQIPCIERNAVSALRAIESAMLARYISNTRKISFDLVTATMYETGKDINSHYRETAEGGLAKLYK